MATTSLQFKVTHYDLAQYPCQTNDAEGAPELAYLTLIGDITEIEPLPEATPEATFNIRFYPDGTNLSAPSIDESNPEALVVYAEMFYSQLASLQAALDRVLHNPNKGAVLASWTPGRAEFHIVVP